MEVRHLRTFLIVAELLSFNRAAERLHNAQSSISAQIQALETELGVQLFDRLGRCIALREAGQSLIQYAEKIVDLADETHAAISGDSEHKGNVEPKETTRHEPATSGSDTTPLLQPS